MSVPDRRLGRASGRHAANGFVARALRVASLLAIFPFGDACAQAGASANDNDALGIAMIAMIAAIAASPFVLRRLIVRRLNALMLRNSGDQAAVSLAELEAPEVEARTQPRFATHDSAAPPQDAVAARERFVANARGLFRKAFLIDCSAGIAYAVLLSVAGYYADPRSTDLAVGLAVFGLAYVLLSALRYAIYRKQFRATHARFGLSVKSLFVGWGMIVKFIVSPRWHALIGGFYVVTSIGLGLIFILDPAGSEKAGAPDPAASDDMRLVGLALIAAGLLHGLLAFWLARSIQRHAGPALLVLRVFGIDGNARFTFGRLLAFWRHFGNYFTIVDPSFWRHRHPLFSLWTLAEMALVATIAFVVLIAIEFVVALFVRSETFTHAKLVAFLPLVAAALVAFVWFSYRRLEAQFIRSRDHLVRMLDRLQRRPRKQDLSFRGLEAMCHDNTWRLTVAEFLRRSDVVLMDLRGFSDARKGCEYEVDFLLDAVPIDRVVFLVEAGGDHAAVHRLILERWRMLRTTSPNLAAREPMVSLYVSKAQDGRDVQGILDLLINAAAVAKVARAANPSAAIPALADSRAA